MPTAAHALRDQLKRPFALANLKALLKDSLFPRINFHRQPRQVDIGEGGLHRVVDLGRLVLPTRDGRQLQVAIFEVPFDSKSPVQVMRNRVGLRALVKQFLVPGTVDAGIGLFHHPGQTTWRFSYIERSTAFDANHLLREEETSPKRYSFLLGPDESCLTAAQRLSRIATIGSAVTREDLLDAFSVERLSDEFFKDYKEVHYAAFVRALQALPEKKRLRAFPAETTTAHEKLLRDFAKKLLGRLVFLHFLQKKGWMGVPAGEPWGKGDRDFFRHFFQTFPNPERFHSEALSSLFFATLNTRRKGDLFKLTDTRVPYLNGGLFDDDPDETQKLDVSSELFRKLFDFFESFNFTIDENAPDDHDVGIDPEMLGRIFENLLEDNKDKGAYYTPKEVVQYMCQESLLRYLRAQLLGADVSDDDPRATALTRFVRQHERGDDNEKNSFIRGSALKLEKLLTEVRICDPAIGSGAFPVGLLQEILAGLTTLDWTLDRAAAKRRIIQDCIYGVDLDAGAVDIARLRFWLSLVVDEITPIPLPNLDYKIMQGNSLLESFEGIRLDQLSGPAPTIQLTVLSPAAQSDLGLNVEGETKELVLSAAANTSRRLAGQLRDYFGLQDQPVKRRLHADIDATVLAHIRHNLALHRDALELRRHRLASNRDENIAAVPSKTQRSAFIEKYPSTREGRELATLNADLARLANSEKKLAELQTRAERPFFLWHLFFQDIFTRGGFDIVIANPPYISHDRIAANDKAAIKESFDTFDPFADLYCYFIEHSTRLLKSGGVGVFITSNSYIKADYGRPIRKRLGQQTHPTTILNIEDTQIFQSAIVNTAILIFSNLPSPIGSRAETIVANAPLTVRDLFAHVATHGQRISTHYLDSPFWVLESPAILEVKAKIEKAGATLDSLGAKIRLGIATGHNGAFVLDEVRRAKLIEKDETNDRIIKPILRGRDIGRYKHEAPSSYIILAKNGVNVPVEYPTLITYFKDFGETFKNRGARGQHWWNLRACAFYEDFDKDRIAWIELSDTPRFSLCEAGIYLLNSAYFILPPADLDARVLLALLNSHVIFFYFRLIAQTSGMGTTRWFKEYVSVFPIPSVTIPQSSLLKNIVEYVLWLLRNAEASVNVRDPLMLAFWEQLINGLIYELYFPQELHRKGLHLFNLVTSAKLPDLSTLAESERLLIMRRHFEKLYDLEHPIRIALHDLGSLQTVRLIEDKE